MALALAMPAYWGGRELILNHRAAPSGSPVVVEAPWGSSLGRIADILHQAGVVDHPRLFMLAARLSGMSGRLRAGEYRLSPAMSYRRILESICRGKVLLRALVIPEGFTMHQIVRRAAARKLLNLDQALALLTDRDFIKSLGLKAPSLEGYLFPTTYLLPKNLGARAALTVMVRRFQAVWRELAPQAKARGLSQRQAVILASIIEREAMLDSERPLISAVYHNRLKKGMRLQADPTVIYGMARFDGNLRKRDLGEDTPYNTYVHPGLPPGPICSPGRASLEAAVEPARTKDLYFVARGDGSHQFSRSYRAHVNAVNRYQRRRRR
jgi:UPF0755 protein